MGEEVISDGDIYDSDGGGIGIGEEAVDDSDVK